jgi:hypothetical protein
MHSMQEQSAAMRCRHDLAVQPPPRALPANAPPVVLRVACRHLSRCNAHHHHHQAAAAAAATGTAAARHARSAAAHAYQPLAVGAAHQPRVRPVTPAPQRLDPATGFVANTASRAKVCVCEGGMQPARMALAASPTDVAMGADPTTTAPATGVAGAASLGCLARWHHSSLPRRLRRQQAAAAGRVPAWLAATRALPGGRQRRRHVCLRFAASSQA